MSRNIEILVRGVCRDGDAILLCHTRGAGNTYLPGGHVEFSEAAKDSLAREIAEELGLQSQIGRFLGAVEHAFIQKGERHCEINLVFECRIPGVTRDAAPASAEGHIDFRWAPIDQLDEAVLEPAPLRGLLGVWLSATGAATERFASTLA